MIEDDEEYLEYFEGTRFHSFDKIDYRRTIHKLVERCLLNSSSPNYNSFVQDLMDSVDFDLRGYPLHRLVDEESKKVIAEISVEKRKWRENHPYDAYHPMKMGLKIAEWDKEYYRRMFKYLHQLLAARGLYLKSGKAIAGGKQMKDPDS